MSPGSWFLVLVWVFWLQLMLPVVAADVQGEGCLPTRRCGNLTISQPFWLSDKETRSCGLLDFEVSCDNSRTPFLRSSSLDDFEIIDILYEERSLHVVDTYDKTALKSCHVPSWNTSTKLSLPFMISPANLNLILYNCTTAAAARQDRALVEMTRMRCGNQQSEVFIRAAGSYNETSDYAGYAVKGCKAIVMPVLGGANGKANASEYKQLISDGFLLTWDPLLPPRKLTHQIIFQSSF
jgi:hypothetical protein